MKNDYEIRGDVTVIFLDRKDGTRLECLIDTEDLPRAMEFPNKWCAKWDKCTKGFYVFGFYNFPIRQRVYCSLHNWLMNPPENMMVDHIFHNTLDNRRYNLRVIPRPANQQNYRGTRSDNTSGSRGVYWHGVNKKWIARIDVNKKSHYLGSFWEYEDACTAVKEARARLMPYSLDAYEARLKEANL